MITEEMSEEEVAEAISESPCPYDHCDGSGYFEEGEYDHFYQKKCLCKIEAEQEASAEDARQDPL